jgi:large-conductance mechanosensitive channel
MYDRFAREGNVMNKPLNFVVLATFIFVIAACANRPLEHTADATYASPQSSSFSYGPSILPIRFF